MNIVKPKRRVNSALVFIDRYILNSDLFYATQV